MKTKIVGRGIYSDAYEYSCVFGFVHIWYSQYHNYWIVKAHYEYDHLFNLSFKTHTEAIAHLDKECYEYIQESVKYLK